MIKKFFKETTCTAELRPVFLGVEQETAPDKVCSDRILINNLSTEFAQSTLIWQLLNLIPPVVRLIRSTQE